MITNDNVLKTPQAVASKPLTEFPDVTQMTGERSCRYGDGMVKNESTVTPVARGNFDGVLPEWGRWQDVQRLFGIKRGTLYTLMAEGKVKSVVLRRKGNVHGCRLIHLESVSQHLNSLLHTQQSQ